MVDPRNTQPGSYGPSGYGAEGREQSRVAPDPGRGGARSNRPGAPNPAGWSPSPAGEAAPPVRHRGPARSDAPSPYDVETRPTAIYQVPWRSPRPANGQGPLRTPQPPAALPRRRPEASRGRSDPRRGLPEASGGAPDSPWPALIRQSPRRIPVLGPVEALRGPAARPTAVPGGGDHGGDHGSGTGWQLAQRAWEASGATWEPPATADQDDWYQADQRTPAPYYPDYPGDYPAEAPESAAADLVDPRPTRPDLPVLPGPADSAGEMGPWPVQTPPEAPEPAPTAPAPPQPEDREHNQQELPPVTPQLSRRIRRASAVWSDHPVGFPGAASDPPPPFTTSAFAPPSPFAPSPAFAAPRSYG